MAIRSTNDSRDKRSSRAPGGDGRKALPQEWQVFVRRDPEREPGRFISRLRTLVRRYARPARLRRICRWAAISTSRRSCRRRCLFYAAADLDRLVDLDEAPAYRCGSQLRCCPRGRLGAGKKGPARLLFKARSRPRWHRLRAVATPIRRVAMRACSLSAAANPGWSSKASRRRERPARRFDQRSGSRPCLFDDLVSGLPRRTFSPRPSTSTSRNNGKAQIAGG